MIQPSKFSIFHEQILEKINNGQTSIRGIARDILAESKLGEQYELDIFRTYVARFIKKQPSPNIQKLATDTFEKTLESNGFADTNNWKDGWLKVKEASIRIVNNNVGGKDIVTFDQMRQDFIEEMKAYSPKYKQLKRSKIHEPHLLVIDIADLHIGKYASHEQTGDGYNSQIAIQRATEGVCGILNKASGYEIDKILFVIGNDILHTDNNKSSTTNLTPQNIDGIWHENYNKAKELYVSIIEVLIGIADVHIVHNPSNHDYVSGYMLADSIASWFRNSPNITFDVSSAFRKYFQYGKNLISTAHGDGAKLDSLPLIMANEAKAMWAETDYRYIYLHHIHHKKQFKFASGNDYHGVNVEYMRSPSGTDEWHSKKGYSLAMKACEGFLHHKHYGQVARLTHLFK
jgi:hypothetical protein